MVFTTILSCITLMLHLYLANHATPVKASIDIPCQGSVPIIFRLSDNKIKVQLFLQAFSYAGVESPG